MTQSRRDAKRDEGLVQRLEQRAARDHRLMEEELWVISQETVDAPSSRTSFKQALLDMPAVGADEDFARISGLVRDVAC